MRSFFRRMITNVRVVGEMMVLLWQHKLWWLIPMVAVLMVIALLFVFASSSSVAPLIYTLF